MNGPYVSTKKAREVLGVCDSTIRNWLASGKLKATRTAGGHFRYLLKDLLSIGGVDEESDSRTNVCYARVSTHSQKDDLERQVQLFRLKFPDHRIIKDFGSGLNFNKKGLKTILDLAIKGNLNELVVTHKDRLCRFGFELLKRIVEECSHGKIVVLDESVTTDPQRELINDLVSIITVFSSRVYGLRSSAIKKELQKIRQETTKPEVSEDTFAPDEGGGEDPDVVL
jgi:putative resolvase